MSVQWNPNPEHEPKQAQRAPRERLNSHEQQTRKAIAQRHAGRIEGDAECNDWGPT